MREIKISEEILKRLRAFKKMIDYVIEGELGKESDYVEFVLSIGMDKMFEDLLPEAEDRLLPKTIVAMFKEKPGFVVDFVIETMKRGELQIRGEEELYKRYIK